MSPFDLILVQYYFVDLTVALTFFVASFTFVTTVVLTD